MLEEKIQKLTEAIEKMTGVLAGLSLVPPEAPAREEKPKATRARAKNKNHVPAEEPKTVEEPKEGVVPDREGILIHTGNTKAEEPKIENSTPVTQALADQAAATAKDKIKAGLIKISETKGDGVAFDILTRFGGAKKLSDIPVENYETILKELEAQGGF